MEALTIDLSNNNGTGIDFGRVRSTGIRGVWLKATEGRTFDDWAFPELRRRARSAGLNVGAYHYARPDFNSPKAEAQHFARVIGDVKPGDLWPVLDFETWASRLTAAQHVQWARDFNHQFVDELGYWPLFYSYTYFIQRLRPDWPIGGGLWLANYGRNDGERHPVDAPAPWEKHLAHQFTSRGRIPGVPGSCDVNWAPNYPAIVVDP